MANAPEFHLDSALLRKKGGCWVCKYSRSKYKYVNCNRNSIGLSCRHPDESIRSSFTDYKVARSCLGFSLVSPPDIEQPVSQESCNSDAGVSEPEEKTLADTISLCEDMGLRGRFESNYFYFEGSFGEWRFCTDSVPITLEQRCSQPNDSDGYCPIHHFFISARDIIFFVQRYGCEIQQRTNNIAEKKPECSLFRIPPLSLRCLRPMSLSASFSPLMRLWQSWGWGRNCSVLQQNHHLFSQNISSFEAGRS